MTRLRRDDSGMTMVELIVAMGIFTMVLVVFLGAMVSMSQTTVRAQVTSDSTSQMRIAYQMLDKELRYASEVNLAGMSNGDYYVEYYIPATVATGESLCVQWRLETSSRELQRRTWSIQSPGDVTGWRTVVTDVRNDPTVAAERPFVTFWAGPDDGKIYVRQRLGVLIDAGLGDRGDGRGGQLNVTMVALNSTSASMSNLGHELVCLGGGVYRP